MCWICDRDLKTDYVNAYWADRLGVSKLHFASVSEAKYTDALLADGVGDLKPPVVSTGLITTADEAGDSIGSNNPTITVGAPSQVATINIIGDQDFFAVTLEAGKTYEIGQYAKVGGPNGTPLADAYIELYDSAGNLVVSADGGGPNTPSGLDALLTFVAITGGTYYINYRAYDNVATDGDNGDAVGDYEYFVREVDPNDPNVYRPYYDVDSPLYALDWGSQVNKVNQSVRNPDGNEGTRDTGNAQGTPVYTSLLDIPALAAAQGRDISGKNVITIYFAKAGDVFTSNDPTNPGLPPATITAVAVQDFEVNAVMTALGEFEKVADIVYLVVQDRNHADFVYTSYQGTPGPGVSLLGSMSPPDESDEGLAQFNSGDSRWNARDLAQGGFSFVTLIHEFGHGHGMAHPHDGGGRSGIMDGVEEDGPAFDYTTGDFALNQSVFTMMSYEDGWQSSPYGNAPTNVGYGYLGGLMAFDIAVIQDKYGVNEEWATGDNVYEMKDVNAAGTFYSSIWDGGGTDEIRYQGARDTTIDLRAATLKYEAGGGGNVSFAFGIYGGFTIANGVTIENATSGSGKDKLIGNSANNVLDSGGGDDFIYLQDGGDDTASGGAGNDFFIYGGALTAGDSNNGGEGSDAVLLQGDYSSLLILGANSLINVEGLLLASGSDARFGDAGGNSYSYNVTTVDANVAAGARLTVNAATLLAGENFTFNGSAESNGTFLIYGGKGTDNITGGQMNDMFFFADGGRWGSGDKIDGGAGFDGMILRGVYSGANKVVFSSDSLTSVEAIGLNSVSDFRFDPGIGTFSYDLTLAEGNVGGTGNLIINGIQLSASELMIVDGGAILTGTLSLYGGAGNDVLKGGAGADILRGNGGGDDLQGGSGADRFEFWALSDSTLSNPDHILDFTSGLDKIDLSKIDADSTLDGDQAFTFIGANAFSAGTPGQLRTYESNGTWFVEGDVNGDGAADFLIEVTPVVPLPLTEMDFIF